MKTEAYEGWAIVELMGHRKLAGYVSQAEQFGCAMLRLDVPSPDADKPNTATQFYGGASIYCLTPTTEDIARGFAGRNQPAPVSSWDLPRLPAPEGVEVEPHEDEQDEGDKPFWACEETR